MIRILTTLCILSLGVASAERAMAQAPTAPSTTITGFDSKTYLETQAPRMAAWRQKISDFDARVETKTTQAGQAAKADVAAAWDSLEKASTNLAAAGVEGWDGAKAAYERALSDMETMWAKYEPAKT